MGGDSSEDQVGEIKKALIDLEIADKLKNHPYPVKFLIDRIREEITPSIEKLQEREVIRLYQQRLPEILRRLLEVGFLIERPPQKSNYSSRIIKIPGKRILFMGIQQQTTKASSYNFKNYERKLKKEPEIRTLSCRVDELSLDEAVNLAFGLDITYLRINSIRFSVLSCNESDLKKRIKREIPTFYDYLDFYYERYQHDLKNAWLPGKQLTF